MECKGRRDILLFTDTFDNYKNDVGVCTCKLGKVPVDLHQRANYIQGGASVNV